MATAVEVDYGNATYAKGPELAAWIEEHCYLSPETDKSGEAAALARNMKRWREEGSRVEFLCVDKWLVSLGRLPAELPNEIWGIGPTRGVAFKGGRVSRARADRRK